MAYGFKSGGREKGTPNKNCAAKRESTQEFFRRILDEEAEQKLWQAFFDGVNQNPIAFQAFKRAVEYKRGMPVQSHIVEERSMVDYGNLSTSYFEQASDARTTDKPN